MKKVLFIMFFVLVFFNGCNVSNSYNVQNSNVQNNEQQDFEDFYNPQITDSIYFERLSDTQHGIYISEDNSVELSDRKYIVEDVLIFRYAYDDAGFLVYHWNSLIPLKEPTSEMRFLNSAEYEIKEDFFTVFDITNDKYFNFKTQVEMLKFCEENNIDLNWKFSNGFSYETVVQTQGGDIWSISKTQSESLMGFVLKNNEIVYEGYISDIYTNHENLLAFKLEIPSKSVLEFHDLKYDDISLSFDKVVKQRRELLFLEEDIYYSKYIIINTLNESIKEFDNELACKREMRKTIRGRFYD